MSVCHMGKLMINFSTLCLISMMLEVLHHVHFTHLPSNYVRKMHDCPGSTSKSETREHEGRVGDVFSILKNPNLNQRQNTGAFDHTVQPDLQQW